jgi:hypothetical protein
MLERKGAVMFKSEIEDLGRVKLPPFTGTRVMMMPFRTEDAATAPFVEWRPVVAELLRRVGPVRGVGYLTLDEAIVRKGENVPGSPAARVPTISAGRAPIGWSSQAPKN